jgi:hypothetical protein
MSEQRQSRQYERDVAALERLWDWTTARQLGANDPIPEMATLTGKHCVLCSVILTGYSTGHSKARLLVGRVGVIAFSR